MRLKTHNGLVCKFALSGYDRMSSSMPATRTKVLTSDFTIATLAVFDMKSEVRPSNFDVERLRLQFIEEQSKVLAVVRHEL